MSNRTKSASFEVMLSTNEDVAVVWYRGEAFITGIDVMKVIIMYLHNHGLQVTNRRRVCGQRCDFLSV